MANPLLYSGARAVIKYQDVNGDKRTLALALDVNVNVMEGVRQTFVLGSYNPVTSDAISYDVSVSIGKVIPVNEPTSTSTIAENRITAMALGLKARINAVLTSQTLQIEVHDKVTQKVIAAVRDCRFAGGSMSVSSTDVASERMTFVGIYDAGYGGNETAPGPTGYVNA